MSATSVLIFTAAVFVLGAVAGAVLSTQHFGGGAKADRNEGKPTRADLKRQFGHKAIRVKAAHIRPSLDAKAAHIDDLSLSLGMRVDGGWPAQEQRAHLEDSHIKIGIPGAGKTIDLKRDIVTFPGAVIASSTKYDILEHVRDRRERRTGGRVFTFNPDRLGGEASTLRWNPVMGCEDPAVAIERAAYFLSGTRTTGGGGVDRNFWDSHANKMLRGFLLVAAHHNLSLFQVKKWANSASDARHAAEMLRRLAEEPDVKVPVQWADEMEQILDSYDKFTGSVFNTLSLTFDFLRDDCEVARIVTVCNGQPNFDAERFLRKRGTLFLLAEKRDFGSIAPLFCALAGYIYETAKQVSRGMRLDPPVLFALDEAPNIVPLPLHDMTPQARGLGITFIACIQTYKQLEDTWGAAKGEIIWNSCPVKHIYPGSHDDAFLEAISRLCGEYVAHETTQTVDAEGKTSTTHSYPRRRKYPVEVLSELPDFHKFVMYGNKVRFIARITPFWQDKKHLKAETATHVPLPPPRRRPPTLPGHPAGLPVGQPAAATITVIPTVLARPDDESEERSG